MESWLRHCPTQWNDSRAPKAKMSASIIVVISVPSLCEINGANMCVLFFARHQHHRCKCHKHVCVVPCQAPTSQIKILNSWYPNRYERKEEEKKATPRQLGSPPLRRCCRRSTTTLTAFHASEVWQTAGDGFCFLV
jgi:hypothetical protein